MTESIPAAAPAADAWNPGIGPGIPPQFRRLETIFRPECSSSSPGEIAELESLTGLPSEELTAFRPERLALHEVIVRVTADLAVAEGEIEENFGQNFRAIARLLLAEAVEPNIARLAADWKAWRDGAAAEIARILETALSATPAEPKRRRWLDRLFAWKHSAAGPSWPPDEADVVAGFRSTGLAAEHPETRAIYRSLYRVLGAIQIRRGRIGGDTALLARLVTDHVANDYGGQLLGTWLSPAFAATIERHGLTRVPPRDAPVLISLKGASAAGKSSLRPMIKRLLYEEGIEPDGYATISPDVWRRLLLDYEALGDAYKYAGHLTSRELMVIDGKLDRYIRRKATIDHAIPHLLVDRFRFDSFESEKIGRVLHETYARHVDTLYMYFVITPPEETVLRGWQRALERGRYKAVEDFLGHSVEAYSGMPKVFFKWVAHERPLYRYSFLDNRVPKGSFPRTIAFGTQREMTICDPLGLVDIARYQRIDVNAETADAVYPATEDFSVEANLGFLDECLQQLPLIRFAETPDAPPYALRQSGQFAILEPERFAALRRVPDLDRVFAHILGE
ncbi:MAG TPA: hypothetical protein VIS73_02825 [Rhodocyclaceae bacterium]